MTMLLTYLLVAHYDLRYAQLCKTEKKDFGNRICLLQICGYVGIDYASATLGVAMGNLTPAFTFLRAIVLR